jgi:uncharacterized MAPEG superfamily protein
MNIQLSTELFYLVLTIGLTSIIWIPYIVNRILEMGLWPALQSANSDLPPKALWAFRMMNAHRNAIENLMIFAPLVLILQFLELNNQTTATASLIFFVTRVAHLIIYTLGIPLLKTVVFFIGFVCQILLMMEILAI